VSVKEILKGLQAVQEVDLKILELRHEGEAYPKRLAELDAMLASARASLQTERNRLIEAERARRDKESEIQAEKEKVKKWEARLVEQRTTREYAALAREIDIAKKALTSMDEDLKASLEQIEEITGALASREAELRRTEDGTAAERAELAEKIAGMSGRIRELSEKRAQVAKNADPALVSRYDTIRKKRGSGLVAVDHGICKGCNMRLPPQLQNLLRAGTLEACPSCQRLIYDFEVIGSLE
jgi:predicted  nucleic acid-binding Zn-ribbon protein